MDIAQTCRAAFEAEHHTCYKAAFEHHTKAVIALNQLADDPGFLDRERKRIARKQAKFHGLRREAVRPILQGTRIALDVILPTALSAQESLLNRDGDHPTLSQDENTLALQMKPLHDEYLDELDPESHVNSRQLLERYIATIDDGSEIYPKLQHVMFRSGFARINHCCKVSIISTESDRRTNSQTTC